MKGLAITNKGIEDVTALELKEIIDAKDIDKHESCVEFSVGKHEDLCKFTYRAQSIFRVMYLFDSIRISKEYEKTTKAIKESIENIDFSFWISPDTHLKIECERHGEHDFRSVDISSEASKAVYENVKEKLGFAPEISLKSPDVVFYIYIYQDKCYLGIDLSGFDLSKRDYRIFSHSASLKGTIAYGMIRLSGYTKDEILLDPFMGAGTIPIEAGIYASGFPLNYYRKNKFLFLRFKNLAGLDWDSILNNKNIVKDNRIYGFDNQLRNLKYTQKNMKIAGIPKLNLSKIDIEWLDTKFEKKSVDRIVSHPPLFSKVKKDMDKLFDEFFYQARFILKDKGKIILITNTSEIIDKAAKKHSFIKSDEKVIFSGKEKLQIIAFENGKL